MTSRPFWLKRIEGAWREAPIVWLLHGRPLDCFRGEQNGQSKSYSLTAEIARWPRVRALVTLWKEHYEYWRVLIPEEKLVLIDSPPIDTKRFSLDAPIYQIPAERRGEINILIADSWRPDVDICELANSTLYAAKATPGVRVHFYAMEKPLGPWEHLVGVNGAYERAEVLGEVWERVQNMQCVYRAMDILLTPHVIGTRTLLEAVACGVYVIGARDNRWATATANPASAESVTEAVTEAVYRIRSEPEIRAMQARRICPLAKYARAINKVYENTMRGQRDGAETWK